MSGQDREIPQRELRNEVSRVLSRADVERILRTAPLDPAFSDDVDGILDETVDELVTG